MNGVLVVDKPKGITSHDVVAMVKRRLSADKVGHLGTLDPLATGVLPLVINRATKYAHTFQAGSKEYVATMKLGEATDTYDREGRVVEKTPISSVTIEDVRRTLMGFCGRIKQTPPMFSAVKFHGTPLYKLARRGMVVERLEKEVEVFSMEIISSTMPFVVFKAICSGGTYIRALCHDAGKALGVGAHLFELTRTRSGVFTLDNAVSPELSRPELMANIISLEKALHDGREGDSLKPLSALYKLF